MTKILDRLPRRRGRGFTYEQMLSCDMRCRVTPALEVAVNGVARRFRSEGIQRKSEVMMLALEEMILQMTQEDPALAAEVRRSLKAEGLPTDYAWLAAEDGSDE